MIKALKKLWSIRATILLWLFRLGVPAGIAWIIFLLDRHIYPVNLDDPHLERRIAFVALWVAIVGFSLAVLGAVLAVLQFQASRRKPNLYLWFHTVDQTTVRLGPNDAFVTLIAQNTGTRVARYIKCKVRFCLPASVSTVFDRVWETPRVGLIPVPRNYPKDSWRVDGNENPVATFVGGSDYIIYDKEPRQTLGVFSLTLEGLEEGRYRVEYQLRCEGMEQKSDKLWIEVVESDA